MAEPVTDAMSAIQKVALDDMRELDEATQNELLEGFWPFPLRLPDFNTTGIECAVLVLRRVFREVPADNHFRAIIFGKMDQTAYKVEKDKLDRTRALIRYSWHHLPDLDKHPGHEVLRLEVSDRQLDLLDILLVDRHMAQSRVSFEALMESEGMVAAFWGTDELQPIRNVVAWQAKDAEEWQTKVRSATVQPLNWKLDLEPSLENNINKRLVLREVDGGNTSMLLPNWPKLLRVKMTATAPVSMSKALEKKDLRLKGYDLLAESDNNKYSVSETHRKYTLIAAVALRSSGELNDIVYTFDSEGREISSSLNKPVPYEPPVITSVMVSEAMLYFSRVDFESVMAAITFSSDSDSEHGLGDRDDKSFRQRMKALDPGACTGLLPISKEAEQRLPKNIGPTLKATRAKFFQR